MEGKAAVAGAVLVATFEAGSFVTEQHSPWRQHGRPMGRAILERAMGDRRDAHCAVTFLERMVVRTRRADHVTDLPAGAAGQEMRSGFHGPIIAIFPKRRSGTA